jgi:hypothetical protein
MTDMIKTKQIDLAFIDNMKNFYKMEFINDTNVRNAWYIFCFHFLPICNKDWKDNLQKDRLRKETIMYKFVTTSDEAIVQFFLELWAPKIKEEEKNNWPEVSKSYGTGDQELKARIDDYSLIHQTLTKYKNHNEGEFATLWNNAFYAELKLHHPTAFAQVNETNSEPSNFIIESKIGIPLPGIDDDSCLPLLVEKHKLTFPEKQNGDNIGSIILSNINNDSTQKTTVNITNKGDINPMIGTTSSELNNDNSHNDEFFKNTNVVGI